jgi:5-methylcytosine-specific restriction enzyme A
MNYVGRPTLAHVQGERLIITPEKHGLSIDEAEMLLLMLPGLIEEMCLDEMSRLRLAIDRARDAGNEPLVEMLSATYKELYQEAPLVFGAARSSQWPRVREAHLAKHPKCEVTGSTVNVEVHHKVPFHDKPELELDPDNLITLRRDVHLLIGHLGNWASYNPSIVEDASEWRTKIEQRPK